MINLEKYKNIISLGYFCGISIDLRKLVLRDYSGPFDWLLTKKYSQVIKLIENNFKDFMLEDNLYQLKSNQEQYYDIKNDIYFFHDFNNYDSLKKQYFEVKEKYDRRIKRFYEMIKEPTIFIRYINNEDDESDELRYIEENNAYINALLKKHNKDNFVIYIANANLKSKVVNIFNVEKENPNDVVSRSPILKNKRLCELLSNIPHIKKQENLNYYLKQNKYKILKKIHLKSKKFFHKKYIHYKIING